MNVKRVLAALVLTGATLTLSGPAHADPNPGGASSVDAEAPAVDTSAVDASAAESPAGEASSDEGITTIEIPGDAAAGNASDAPTRDSHISLTNAQPYGGKFAFAGVTGIDNQNKG
ncbi:hypothetical protein [Streptomyces sp. NPDC051211]|uniref:hypothetical protein n=1 Tax=Streptomyces sp. NPDC051211 TaxID=3154643 RepID=UPI00344D8BC8